ncbi:PAS-domain containing protein [Nitrincola alkalilacustris]|uniref:PAS-domain containing protein n=1 Tax=Nitrincola alkalilacustris TaxID=1571224 RepID=UPI00124CCFE1|nr:PAS-domain containing protein [Nitrincola alkalilacustris]
MSRLRWRNPFHGMRARTRLMLAFTILAGSSIMLALVGWTGLSDTDTALNEFEQQALPDILRSLALAERTANLAAVAPYVANTSSPSLLNELNLSLKERIDNVLAIARDIPELDNAAPGLSALLSQLEITITELTGLTHEHLLLREDIRQLEYRLGLLREKLYQHEQNTDAHVWLPSFLILLDQLSTALHLEDSRQITQLQQQFALALNESDSLIHRYPQIAAFHHELQFLGTSDLNLFEQRRQQLQLQQRRAFLLTSTRAVSEQLSTEVKQFVDQVQQRITHQGQRMGVVVKSGKTGILMIALLCFAAAVGGILVVRELTRSLGEVTSVMSRLAAGDRERQTPAVERLDEIGELARAFEVFRENALAIDQMSQHLKEQSRLLETIFDNINDGLSVFDSQNRLVAWNPQYADILELPVDKLHSGLPIETIYTLLSQEAQEGWALDGMMLDRDEVNQLRKQRAQRFERHFPGGRVVEFRSNPMPDGGFVTLYSDLTERKTIEAQLRQSQKMEVLGQLTGGVAHDFNNLLTAIFGNLQLLEEQLSPDARERRFAGRALAAAERGRLLTQRLLAFSRKQHLQPEEVEVDGLIEGMLDLIEYSVGDQIEIRLDLQAAHWLVSVDPSQLENALLNLAINSSAAMQGKGVLTFTTRFRAQQLLNGEQQDLICISVTDTGCGIPAPLIRRVFEPFFTTKEIGEGSGLGLSMVYGFVKQSNGDIQVWSEVGRGTRIDILLPRQLTRVTETAPLPQPLPLLGRGQHLLVVEDDRQVAESTTAMLTTLNYQISTVHSAADALALLAATDDIALVFTDINLGSSIDGLQLGKQIHDRWPELPLLYTSGLPQYQQPDHHSTDITLLPKPYTRETLSQAVAILLQPTPKESPE